MLLYKEVVVFLMGVDANDGSPPRSSMVINHRGGSDSGFPMVDHDGHMINHTCHQGPNDQPCESHYHWWLSCSSMMVQIVKVIWGCPSCHGCTNPRNWLQCSKKIYKELWLIPFTCSSPGGFFAPGRNHFEQSRVSFMSHFLWLWTWSYPHRHDRWIWGGHT